MKQARLKGVWIILIWCWASLLLLAISHFLIFSGKMPLSPEQKVHFDGMGFFDHIMTFAVTVTGVVASTLLFLRKKAAVNAFLAMTVLVPVIGLVQLYLKGFAQVGLVDALGLVFSVAVTVTFYFYARKAVTLNSSESIG